MMIFKMTQVHELVNHSGPEGLWTSFGSQNLGEMMVQRPSRSRCGDPIPEVRDVSVRRLRDSEDHVVAAHTELGAIFLSMLAAGEL